MPLRMGRVKQIYYWPVLWCSSVEAGKGDIIGMEERLCNWGGVHAKIPWTRKRCRPSRHCTTGVESSNDLRGIPTVHHSKKLPRVVIKCNKL